MKAITITTDVKNGKFTRNTDRIAKAVKYFEGKTIDITMKKQSQYRSNQQNGYYFGVIIPMTITAVEDEWGEIWNSEEAHEMFKTMFLYNEKVNDKTGEIVKTPKSSTENSTKDQEVYHEKCRQFLKEWFNVDVPLPNEGILFE